MGEFNSLSPRSANVTECSLDAYFGDHWFLVSTSAVSVAAVVRNVSHNFIGTSGSRRRAGEQREQSRSFNG